MPDIFISYSKADHALALKLSAFLESEGWTVWWDKSLGAADLYRDEIMKQLAAARAVITIWTPNSIRSDWVRAEAGRAKAEGKLIPVKTPDVAYADIPLPFGEMHTENVGSMDLIRAAVVAQLAKPAVSVPQSWQIAGLFKYQVLTWIGIVGSAITVFAGLSAVLNLADWAKWLVSQWHDWTQIFWGRVFSLLKLEVPKELAPLLSFSTFTTMLVRGPKLTFRPTKPATKSIDDEKPIVTLEKFRNLGFGTFFILLFLMWGEMELAILFPGEWPPILAIGLAVGVPMVYLLCVVKERVLVLIASLLFFALAECLFIMPMERVYGWSGFLALMLQAFWLVVILRSPLRRVTQRLSFVVIGVLTLVVLSEISKLHLHQYLQPPKVSDNSVR